MKKTIILSIVFCALFAYMPFAAQAADDPSISSVSVTPTSSAVGATETYTASFTTTATLSNGTTIYLYGFEPGGGETLSFANTVPTSSTVPPGFTYETSMEDVVMNITLPGALAPGTWSFVLPDVINPSTDATMVFGVTTEVPGEDSNVTYADDSIIIGSGSSDSLPFSAIELSANAIADERVDYTFAITLSDTLPADTSFGINVYKEDEDDVVADFNDMELDEASSEIPGLTCDVGYQGEAADCTTGDQDLEPGTYNFILKKITNPEQIGDVYAQILYRPDGEGGDLEYIESENPLTIHNIGKLKKKKIEVLKKKSKRPQFKAKKRITDTNWNKVKLMKKKGKKYEKVKTFNFKKLKKRPKKKYFKYKKYKIKWKACYRYNDKEKNEVCGAWAIKTFKLN